ncbi:MAG: dihydrofolate reductase family protein [Bacteroidota bacterium]|nr:dihydrofolate reductase family protein [Bacteroidota bacterium]
MRKLMLFDHVSLDGFVAGPEGEMDWIKVDNELFDFGGKLIDEADTGLYGRVTYEMMQNYWPGAADLPNASKHDIEHSQWYNRVDKVVISKSLKGSDLEKTQIISGNIQHEITKIKEQPGRNIIMFGSPSAAYSLMEYNLIDEYWIFLNPILIGKGILLFKNIQHQIHLKLAATKIFQSGVAALNYKKE